MKSLAKIYDMPDPYWLDGKPYYCTYCWRGWDDFLQCNSPDCELESTAEARKRQAQHERNEALKAAE